MAEFDFLLDQLWERAAGLFLLTPQAKLLQQQLDQMEENCLTMLREEELRFVQECFEQLRAVDAGEEQFVYRQAWNDCIALLPSLGVLS